MDMDPAPDDFLYSVDIKQTANLQNLCQEKNKMRTIVLQNLGPLLAILLCLYVIFFTQVLARLRLSNIAIRLELGRYK